jgi:hypothetical protein
MAILCRCKSHAPHADEYDYTHCAQPVGYPETSTICGSVNCNEPALIYMTPEDVFAYNFGERIFKFPTFEVKVRLNDIAPVHL